MTQEQFDNYKFSSKTEVKVDNNWWKINNVNLKNRDFFINRYDTWFNYDDIQDIRN